MSSLTCPVSQLECTFHLEKTSQMRQEGYHHLEIKQISSPSTHSPNLHLNRLYVSKLCSTHHPAIWHHNKTQDLRLKAQLWWENLISCSPASLVHTIKRKQSHTYKSFQTLSWCSVPQSAEIQSIALRKGK